MVLTQGVVREFTKEIADPPRMDVLIAKVLRFVVLTPGTVRVFDKLIVEPISEDTTRLVALISLARIKVVLISAACKERCTKAVLVKIELVFKFEDAFTFPFTSNTYRGSFCTVLYPISRRARFVPLTLCVEA